MKIVVALLVASIASLAADRAHACAAPACGESWSAPDVGRTVPANAPAIVFSQGNAPYGGSVMPGPPVLSNAAGAIAATRDGLFLRPTAALPLGDVTLAWDEACVFPPTDAGLPRKQLAFTVAAATPLPTTLGTVTYSYARENVSVQTSSGSCTDKLDASVAKFAFALDPALSSFRHVARFVTRVDGKEWGSSAWGREGPVAKPAYYGGDFGAHHHDSVFAGCGPSPNGVTDRGVAVGKHTVEIRAEVAGAPALPAATFEIDLRCEGTVADGGVVTPDADESDVASGDVSSSGDTATARVPSEGSSGGCATGRSARSPLAAGLVLSFVALAQARRRRSRSLHRCIAGSRPS